MLWLMSVLLCLPLAHSFTTPATLPRAVVSRRVSACFRVRCSALADVGAASELLAEYDAGHRAAAASEGARGFGGALTANEWAATADYSPLAAAVRTLAEAVSQEDPPGRLMFGICASDAASGVQALKAWVTALGLPKGPLHGMDKDGVPLDMSDFGGVYIKYSSLPLGQDPGGCAMLSGYTGEFRGVYFNPSLADGQFRQFAVLPLDLFASETPIELSAAATKPPPSAAMGSSAGGGPAAARAVSESSAGSNTRGAGSVGQQRKAAEAAGGGGTVGTSAASSGGVGGVEETLRALPLLASLSPLGIEIGVAGSDDDDGLVRLSYAGPPKLRRAVEVQVRTALTAADPRVGRVEFVDTGGAD